LGLARDVPAGQSIDRHRSVRSSTGLPDGSGVSAEQPLIVAAARWSSRARPDQSHQRRSDISARAGVAPHRRNGLGVAVADYDVDERSDAFVANDGVPNFLFHGDANGRFTERALVAGVSVGSDGKARQVWDVPSEKPGTVQFRV
jgi:hypothetical protein